MSKLDSFGSRIDRTLRRALHKCTEPFGVTPRELLNKCAAPLGISPLPPRIPWFFIELTNKCNLRCPICPRSDAAKGRGLGFMDFDLYKHIVDSISAYGAVYVGLNRFGESLLYPRFLEALAYAKRKQLPSLVLVTNATLLTKEMAEGIVDLELDEIRMSLDSLDPEAYAAGRIGAKLDITLANIDYLLSYKKKRAAVKPHAIVNSVLMHDNFDQVKKVYDRFRGICEVDLKPLAHYGVSQNWEKIKKYEDFRRRPCIQPWERINFFYNGDANICCGDVEGELIIGNIKESTIQQLWYGKRAKEIRQLHTALDFSTLTVCQVCDGINADWYADALKQQIEVLARLDPSKKVIRISNASAILDKVDRPE